MIRVVCGCGRVFKAEERHSGKRTRCPVCGSEPDHRADAGLELERGGPGRGPVVVVSERSAGPVRVGLSHCESAPATRIRCRRRSFRRSPSMSWRWNGRMPRGGRPSGRSVRGRPRPRGPAALGPDGGRGGVGRAGPGGAGAGCARPPPAPASGPGARGWPPRGTAAGARRARGPGMPAIGAGPRPSPDGRRHRGPTVATARPRLHLPERAKAASNGVGSMDAAAKVDLIVIVNPEHRARHRAQSRLCRGHRRGRRPRRQAASATSTPITPTVPPPEVKGDIDAWVRFYPRIVGFFLDQQPREAGHTAYFIEIGAYARSKIRDAIVITDPGVPCDEAYLARRASDLICVFANFRGLRLVRDPGQPQGLRPFPLCRPGVPGRGRRGDELDAQGCDHQAHRLRLRHRRQAAQPVGPAPLLLGSGGRRRDAPPVSGCSQTAPAVMPVIVRVAPRRRAEIPRAVPVTSGRPASLTIGGPAEPGPISE